jgi:hypothetical protein
VEIDSEASNPFCRSVVFDGTISNPMPDPVRDNGTSETVECREPLSHNHRGEVGDGWSRPGEEEGPNLRSGVALAFLAQKRHRRPLRDGIPAIIVLDARLNGDDILARRIHHPTRNVEAGGWQVVIERIPDRRQYYLTYPGTANRKSSREIHLQQSNSLIWTGEGYEL